MKKNKMRFFLYIFLILIVFSSCSGGTINQGDTNNTGLEKEENKMEYRKITAEKAKEIMDGDEDFIIVDVRTEAEFNEKHIPNAILIPNEIIGSDPPAELPDKEALILIYCRSGNRSKTASEKLIKMGYTNIYDFGGIIDWDYETVP